MPSRSLAGQVIAGKYRVERELGRGGMSVVVEADHLKLSQKVALKLLHRHVAEAPEAHDRILAEARAAAQISSEHAVRIIDVGTLDDGAPFIVMECLTGADLRSHLATSGTIEATEAIDFMLQACDALADAHARGIVHRDLKPANMFLTRRADGTPLVKVLDFGFAKLEGATDLPTTMGGSPGYASPEQLQRGRPVDARADVWALGVILYQLVSGRLPFDGPGLKETLVAALQNPPPPLTTARGELPAGFERVVLRCLQSDPELRFANVRELAEALAPMGPPSAQAYVRRIGEALAGARGRKSRPPSDRWLVDAAPSALLDETQELGPSTQTTDIDRVATRDAMLVAEVIPQRSTARAAVVVAVALVVILSVALSRPRPSAPAQTPASVASAVSALDAAPPEAPEAAHLQMYVPPPPPTIPAESATAAPPASAPDVRVVTQRRAPRPTTAPATPSSAAISRPNPLSYR